MKLDLKKVIGNLLLLVLILLLLSRVMSFRADIQPSPVSAIESESMEPTFSTGDLVFWHHTSIDKIEEGDIIVFSSDTRDGELIIHRVVEIRETPQGRELITQGDANEDTDQESGEPPVKEENLLGKPVSLGGSPFHIPRVGYIWIWGGALFLGAIKGGVAGEGIAMLVPLLTAGVMLIATVVFFVPEEDEDEDEDDDDDEIRRLILEEEKTRALQIFLIILIAFIFVIVPSTWYGSGSTTLSIGVEEEAENADFSYSAERGEVIEGNQTVRNPGFTPLMHHVVVEGEGEGSEWIKVDKKNFRTEAGANSTVEFTVNVPQDAEPGTYNKKLVNYHSSFWVIYPESFVGFFIEASPSHGVLMLNIFTSFVFALITLLLMLFISYLIDEYILWREYHRTKRTVRQVEKKKDLSLWDRLLNSKKRLKRKTLDLFDWVRGVNIIDFEPKKPIYAGMIGLAAIPLHLLGADLWSFFLLVPISSAAAYYLGCRWRAEIFTAALLCGGIAALAFLYIPFAIPYLSTLNITNIILTIQSLAVVILIFLILVPIILLTSYLTVMTIHKYRIKNSPRVVNELSDI